MKALLAILLAATAAFGQNYSQRGYLENRFTLYPQDSAVDDTNTIAETLLRYEGFYDATPSLQLAGAVDVRIDTHHQVDRELRVSWWDREVQRPLLSIRRLSALWYSGNWSVEVGKQFVRWGKADILNPTDRFAPRDYLAVVDTDYLGVTAARLTYSDGTHSIDAVFSPRFTPSRIPLAGQRWMVQPETDALPGLRIDAPITRFPGGPQMGIRWNRIGWLEFSTSYYEGFSDTPAFDVEITADPTAPEPQPVARIEQYYPKLRMAGGDLAVPLSWLTLKAEGGYFHSPDVRVDNYVLFVIQAERTTGEWYFTGGYAGAAVTREGTEPGEFTPERGLARTFLGRAGYTLDTNRSVAIETAVRQNGDGAWLEVEYSQAFGNWRATGQLTLIRGDRADFLGQYRDNSHAALVLRYSF